MEVLKSLLPMVLGALFVFTAAMFMSMGIKKKEERKIAFTGAIIIELLSFTIWIPSFSDLFSAIGLEQSVKQTAMIIVVIFVLLCTVVVTIFELKKET